jgi:hypothetical protein
MKYSLRCGKDATALLQWPSIYQIKNQDHKDRDHEDRERGRGFACATASFPDRFPVVSALEL